MNKIIAAILLSLSFNVSAQSLLKYEKVGMPTNIPAIIQGDQARVVLPDNTVIYLPIGSVIENAASYEFVLDIPAMIIYTSNSTLIFRDGFSEAE